MFKKIILTIVVLIVCVVAYIGLSDKPKAPQTPRYEDTYESKSDHEDYALDMNRAVDIFCDENPKLCKG